MIIATTTEFGTDEDTELASRVTRSIIDNFLRRPSLEDQAIRMIAIMANNDLFMMRREADESLLCDAAFVFVDRNRARFLISGRSAAYHFENGKLVHRSLAEETDAIGDRLRYEPRPEAPFELREGENAFLTVSRTFAETVEPRMLEETLQASKTPEEWMERLKTLVGEEKEFCAIAAFLPPTKPGLFNALFKRA